MEKEDEIPKKINDIEMKMNVWTYKAELFNYLQKNLVFANSVMDQLKEIDEKAPDLKD